MTGLNITVARVPFPTWFCPGAAQSSTEAAQTCFFRERGGTDGRSRAVPQGVRRRSSPTQEWLARRQRDRLRVQSSAHPYRLSLGWLHDNQLTHFNPEEPGVTQSGRFSPACYAGRLL